MLTEKLWREILSFHNGNSTFTFWLVKLYLNFFTKDDIISNIPLQSPEDVLTENLKEKLSVSSSTWLSSWRRIWGNEIFLNLGRLYLSRTAECISHCAWLRYSIFDEKLCVSTASETWLSPWRRSWDILKIFPTTDNLLLQLATEPSIIRKNIIESAWQTNHSNCK